VYDEGAPREIVISREVRFMEKTVGGMDRNARIGSLKELQKTGTYHMDQMLRRRM
jgi:hypothetical protein